MNVVKSHGWKEMVVERVHLPDDQVWQTLRESDTRFFRKGFCNVMISREQPSATELRKRWHLSISCASRYPTWDEIKDARYSLLPMSLTFAQILPPLNDFVNIHPNCFHLWEIEWNG